MASAWCSALGVRGPDPKEFGNARKGSWLIQMKELVEYIAKTIASYPDEVKVTEEIDQEDRVMLKLEVAPDDKGKVVGRHGRVAKSIRLLLQVAAVKQGVRVNLEIV